MSAGIIPSCTRWKQQYRGQRSATCHSGEKKQELEAESELHQSKPMLLHIVAVMEGWLASLGHLEDVADTSGEGKCDGVAAIKGRCIPIQFRQFQDIFSGFSKRN
jgi:hypothetical protein